MNVSTGTQPEIGTIPQGFEVFTNAEGRREMRPIKGGPADISEAEKGKKAEGARQEAIAANTVPTLWLDP